MHFILLCLFAKSGDKWSGITIHATVAPEEMICNNIFDCLDLGEGSTMMNLRVILARGRCRSKYIDPLIDTQVVILTSLNCIKLLSCGCSISYLMYLYQTYFNV